MKITRKFDNHSMLYTLELTNTFTVRSTISAMELKNSNLNMMDHKKNMMIDRFYNDILQLKGISKVHQAIYKVKSLDMDRGLQSYIISILSDVIKINDERNYNIEFVDLITEE